MTSASRLRESATFDRGAIAAIQQAAETGVYDIRGWGAKRAVPHFDDLLFLGASMSRYPLEGYRERCDTDVVLGDRHALAPLHLDIPVTIAGMSFGALSAQAKEALGRGASARSGTSTTTGDGGMTPEERGQSQPPRVPVPAVAVRDEPRRPAQRRRHRGRPRAGREARRRRDAARAEDLRAGGRDAHAARGHRPAQRLPPPRLDGSRRPRHQDHRAARDHRLAPAGLRQGRRDADLLRREARGGRGRRRRRRRRDAGRHRRHAGGVHRARRHPDPRGDPAGGAGPAGARPAPQGPADRLGRHPYRGRRREGDGARRRRGRDRDGGAHRAGRQRAALRRPTTRRSAPPPGSTTTSRTAATPPASPPRTRSSPHGWTRSRAGGGSRTTCGC